MEDKTNRSDINKSPRVIVEHRSMVLAEPLEEQEIVPMAELALKNKKYRNAIALFTTLIEMNPSNLSYYRNRLSCNLRIPSLAHALIDAETVCEIAEIDQSSTEFRRNAHYTCGCILGELGKMDFSKLPKAETRLKTALRLCSNSDDEWRVQIKMKRLRKLMWFKRRERQLSLAELELKLAKRAYESKEICEDQYKTLCEAIEQRKAEWQAERSLPSFCVCKITNEVMKDPAVNDAGFAYESQPITTYYASNRSPIDPTTRAKVSRKTIKCFTLKSAIEDFVEQNPWAFEFDCQNYLNIQMMANE